MRILNEELVREAIRIAESGILAILNHEGATWGPKWVWGYVEGPGLDEPVSFQFGIDISKEWDSEWGQPDRFRKVAEKKAGRGRYRTDGNERCCRHPAMVFGRRRIPLSGRSQSRRDNSDRLGRKRKSGRGDFRDPAFNHPNACVSGRG